MTAERDELWVDMAQFDTRLADGLWDGVANDPDAPGWYADVRSLVHRARGPAEAHELADEPVMVERMRRATLGETLADLPRRPGVRLVGRVVAMKAAAATTASVMTMAAAAATTGIVATVAATVVMPAIHERVMPILGVEAEQEPTTQEPVTTPSPAADAPAARQCDQAGTVCVSGPDEAPVIRLPASAEPAPVPPATEPVAEPAPEVEAEPAPVVTEPPAAEVPVAEVPVTEPPAEVPVSEVPVTEPPPPDPTTTEVPPAEEPPAEEPTVEPAIATDADTAQDPEPAVTADPAPVPDDGVATTSAAPDLDLPVDLPSLDVPAPDADLPTPDVGQPLPDVDDPEPEAPEHPCPVDLPQLDDAR